MQESDAIKYVNNLGTRLVVHSNFKLFILLIYTFVIVIVFFSNYSASVVIKRRKKIWKHCGIITDAFV